MGRAKLVYTTHGKLALDNATKITKDLKQTVVTPLHCLLGLAQTEGSDSAKVLNHYGITAEKLLIYIETLEAPEEAKKKGADSKISLSDDTTRVLEHTVTFTRNSLHLKVSTAHLLVGLMSFPLDSLNDLNMHFNITREGIIKSATEQLLNDDASEERIPRSHPMTVGASFRGDTSWSGALMRLIGIFNIFNRKPRG